MVSFFGLKKKQWKEDYCFYISRNVVIMFTLSVLSTLQHFDVFPIFQSRVDSSLPFMCISLHSHGTHCKQTEKNNMNSEIEIDFQLNKRLPTISFMIEGWGEKKEGIAMGP